jgi:hypothetical protein
MIIFHQGSPKTLKMYCKIIEACGEPLGEMVWKKWKENKMGGGQGLYSTLGWSRDFPIVCGEPLKSINCFKTPKESSENILARSA